MRRYILVLVLLAMALMGSVRGQVLGGSSTFGYSSGLGFYVGTHSMSGRSFGLLDEHTYQRKAVVPDSYCPRLVNPIFGIGWWSENPSDDFVFGYQIMANYGAERYQVSFGSEMLEGKNKVVGLSLGAYLGWHFAERLTACVGVQTESRTPISEGGRLGIFNSQNNIGLTAKVRYAFFEDFYVALHASYGLFLLGNFGFDDEEYKSIGDEGYYVVESGVKPFVLMVGIGRGF